MDAINKSITFSQDVINKAMHWLATEDTGLSSTLILTNILSQGSTGSIDSHETKFHPRDPADLKRCITLLEHVPEFKSKLHIMKDVSPQWSALIDNWDQLELSLKSEIKIDKSRAPNTYKLMKSILGDIKKI